MSAIARYLLGPSFDEAPQSLAAPVCSREQYFDFWPANFQPAAPRAKLHLPGVLRSELVLLKLIGAFCGANLIGSDGGSYVFFMRMFGDDAGEVGVCDSGGDEGMRSVTSNLRAFESLLELTDEAMASCSDELDYEFAGLAESEQRRLAKSIASLDGEARLSVKRGPFLMIDHFAEGAQEEGLLKKMPSMSGRRLEKDFNRAAWIIAVLLNLKNPDFPLPVTQKELSRAPIFETSAAAREGDSAELLYRLWRGFLLDENYLPEVIEGAQAHPGTFLADCANFISGDVPDRSFMDYILPWRSRSLMDYMLPWKRSIRRSFKIR